VCEYHIHGYVSALCCQGNNLEGPINVVSVTREKETQLRQAQKSGAQWYESGQLTRTATCLHKPVNSFIPWLHAVCMMCHFPCVSVCLPFNLNINVIQLDLVWLISLVRLSDRIASCSYRYS
jgi:hypothetical protein